MVATATKTRTKTEEQSEEMEDAISMEASKLADYQAAFANTINPRDWGMGFENLTAAACHVNEAHEAWMAGDLALADYHVCEARRLREGEGIFVGEDSPLAMVA